MASPYLMSEAILQELEDSWGIVVQEYTDWQRTQVLSDDLKTRYVKAGDTVLKHGWDLEQLHRRKNTKFLVDEGILEGIAERFVEDISEWVQGRQGEST
jgi:hypothetical protein